MNASKLSPQGKGEGVEQRCLPVGVVCVSVCATNESGCERLFIQAFVEFAVTVTVTTGVTLTVTLTDTLTVTVTVTITVTVATV